MKKRMRALALTLAAAMVVTALPVQNVSAATKKPALTAKSVVLTVGKNKQLKVKNAKGAALKWVSSNKKIATVSKKGVVKAVKKGTAKVTCTVTTKAKKTYKLTTKIKVENAKNVTVSTQKQLNAALKNKSLVKLTIKTAAKKELKIPAGNYQKVTLVVDAKNGTIYNNGIFKTITIKNLASDTWYEYAAGNNIIWNADQAHLVVCEGASLTSLVINSEKEVKIEVNGVLAKVEVNKPAKITLAGEKSKEITLVNNCDQAIQITTADGTSTEVAAKATVEHAGTNTSAADTDTKTDSTTATDNTKTDTNTNTSASDGSSTSGGATSSGGRVVPTPAVRDNYKLVWEDNFEGTELNRNDWNVETHAKGWVNSEQQAYVDSADNIYVKDGKLVLKPIKHADGSITSGRVNTQGKHDFKYGKFEARIKVPTGQGYLPAFWMMPTDENLYGQWPRCGEIDIAEVMGQDTNKAYGTIHYGNPHQESQGTTKAAGKSFSEDYHVFSVEWEPGSIKWYCDDVLYHQENDWYSTTEGKGTVSYPAPFDQPFYVILNLAVGGSWVGMTDDTTTFEDQEYSIDYVRVYQKDSYNENVKKPVKTVTLRDPDANGNYINNGDFTVAEDLTDDKDWAFMTALDGESTAAIENNTMKIKTTKEGTADYSVQLVQANVPLEKGATYRISFDAKAGAARTMNVDVKAPDHGYAKYMSTTFKPALTTEKQTFTTEFKMASDSDANGRLEFNMGAMGSTADIELSNVKIEKIKAADPNEKEVKTVLSDGNYVYNGEFQEGDARLGYWEIENKANAKIAVTNTNNVRELAVEVAASAGDKDVVVGQSDLALTQGKYELSFTARADSARTIPVEVAGTVYEVKVGTTEATETIKVTVDANAANKNIKFYLGAKGTIYLDNIRLVEDTLIKNGSFNAGTAGYEVYVNDAASASSVVDSISEDHALDLTIDKTGAEKWYIQLKQDNVTLEKDQWYVLSFKIKSDLARDFQYAIQRNGSVHKTADGGEDWTAYVQSDDKLNGDGKYQTITNVFQMKEPTDAGSGFNIALGGGNITQKHRVCIDDIELRFATEEEVAEKKKEIEDATKTEAGVNMLKNADFSEVSDGKAVNWEENVADPGIATYTHENGAVIVAIDNIGTEDYHVQMKQFGLPLEKGAKYKLTYTASSTEERMVNFNLMSTKYDWYAGKETVLTADPQDFKVEFTMEKDSDPNAGLFISLGKTNDEAKASTVTISKLSLVKVADAPETGETTEGGDTPAENPTEGGDTPAENPTEQETETNLLHSIGWGLESDKFTVVEQSEDCVKINITNLGSDPWDVQPAKYGVRLEAGVEYQLSYKIVSNETRSFIAGFQNKNDGTIQYNKSETKHQLVANQELGVTTDVKSDDGDQDAMLYFNLGKAGGDEETPLSTITISDVKLVKVNGTSSSINNLLLNSDFSAKKEDGTPENWTFSVQEDAEVAAKSFGDGIATVQITTPGAEEWHIQFIQDQIKVESGKTYKLSFKIKSSVARKMKWAINNSADDYKYGNDEVLEADQEVECSKVFTADSTDWKLLINLGKYGVWSPSGTTYEDTAASTITIWELQIVEQ